MDYHPHNRSGDGVIRIPIDGYSFREIEEKRAVFKDEPFTVRIYDWQLTKLIHLESSGLFTQCGQFLLSTITFLLGC